MQESYDQFENINSSTTIKIIDSFLDRLNKTNSTKTFISTYRLVIKLLQSTYSRELHENLITIYRRIAYIFKDKIIQNDHKDNKDNKDHKNNKSDYYHSDKDILMYTLLYLKAQKDFNQLIIKMLPIKNAYNNKHNKYMQSDTDIDIDMMEDSEDMTEDMTEDMEYSDNAYCDFETSAVEAVDDLIKLRQSLMIKPKVEQKIEQKIEQKTVYTLSSIEVGGGGDCFYYTVCYMLNKLNNFSFLTPYDLRKIVCSHIMNMSDDKFAIHKAVYEGEDYKLKDLTRETLCEIMMDRKYDSDNTGIAIIGDHFKIKFLIYSVAHNRFNICGYDNDDYEYIEILFHTNNHYQVGVVEYTDDLQNTNNTNKFVFSFCRRSEITEHITNFLKHIGI